ncbi:unnamed protein product [Oikopleura dioica]|uniref:Uncharacterized protein n=1 Tax=Oikopleura dioica TaxID=34765 RepID=E4YPM1_OIKDI|nr:unnamed protein product [Oikopleura dioica]
MSELQKMIFLNAFWLALVASFGSYKSIELLRSSSIKLNSTELDAEITVTFSDERINLNFRTLYLKCLVLVLLLSFCMSTYWLLYFLNPAQKIKSKTFISIMITTNGIASLNLLHGFIVLIGDKSTKPMNTMSQEDQTTFVMLFIVSVLAFSSNLFFAKLGFQIQTHPRPSPIPEEERALYWLLRQHQETQRAAAAERDSPVPGVSDDPPKILHRNVASELQFAEYKQGRRVFDNALYFSMNGFSLQVLSVTNCTLSLDF